MPDAYYQRLGWEAVVCLGPLHVTVTRRASLHVWFRRRGMHLFLRRPRTVMFEAYSDE